MIDASTAGGRGPDRQTPERPTPERPNDAEPFFPSEGSFSAVVPLSEVGRAPAPRVDAAGAGRPAEAAWAREENRATRVGNGKEEDETTLVPARAGRATAAARADGAGAVRHSWGVTALVLLLSVAAGLASGTYLLWSSGRAPEARQTAPPTVAEKAQAAAEAPDVKTAPANAATPTPAEAVDPANAKDEKVSDVARVEKVDKAEKVNEVERVPKETPRPERPARAAAAAAEVAPAPKLARSQAAAPPRQRVATAERQQPHPTTPERTLPISSPPPSAKSKKVIQWP